MNPSSNSNRGHTPISNARFATTHWSVVLAAGDRADTQYECALQALCQTYWYPLYAYARHRGHQTPDAEDLIQSFFMRIMEKDVLARITRDKGRFRSFLLTALNHFRIDEWKQARTEKRGAGRTIVGLEMDQAEERYRHEPVDTTTPETLFDQNWAVTLLNTVFDQLQQEQAEAGRGERFKQLKFCLTGQRSAVPYTQLAEKLNLSEAALKVQVHRLRKRYRELLRQEVAHTVSSPEDIEEEMQHLFEVLSGG
jgi:RNA polymerase sigma factor (sigma-70 family)